MAKHDDKSPAENSGPERRGRPFAKGRSGNPGGRPKAEGDFRKRMMEMSPEVAGALEEFIRGPTPEQLLEDKSPFWFQAMAEKRIAAIKVWCEFTIPKPKAGDEFDKPLAVVVDPEKITTLGLVSDVRLILATEIKRLEAFSTAGLPLSESATVRLTECVKQLATLAEQEKKILEADPMANKSEADLRKLIAEAHVAGSH